MLQIAIDTKEFARKRKAWMTKSMDDEELDVSELIRVIKQKKLSQSDVSELVRLVKESKIPKESSSISVAREIKIPKENASTIVKENKINHALFNDATIVQVGNDTIYRFCVKPNDHFSWYYQNPDNFS